MLLKVIGEDGEWITKIESPIYKVCEETSISLLESEEGQKKICLNFAEVNTEEFEVGGRDIITFDMEKSLSLLEGLMYFQSLEEIWNRFIQEQIPPVNVDPSCVYKTFALVSGEILWFSVWASWRLSRKDKSREITQTLGLLRFDNTTNEWVKLSQICGKVGYFNPVGNVKINALGDCIFVMLGGLTVFKNVRSKSVKNVSAKWVLHEEKGIHIPSVCVVEL